MRLTWDRQDRWIAAGTAAVPFVLTLVALRLANLPLPIRLPLALFGTVGVFLFGVGLYSLLRRRRETLTLQLGVLAFGGYTLFLLVDAVVYAAIARAELGQLVPERRDMVLPTLEVWIVILDMLKGFLNSLATFLFSVNLIGYSRLGTGLGAAGIMIAFVQFGQKLVTFPSHPLFLSGMIAGMLWVLGVAFFMGRSLLKKHDIGQAAPRPHQVE